MAPTPTPPPAAAPEAPRNRERLVLVAHPEKQQGKALAESLSGWGLEVLLVHDGVEAILNIQRSLPRVVVLDAALPKMFGFQVCELMKRNESLQTIHVVLVGSIHDQDRYRRPPGDLYGADTYVEPQDLPDALRPLFSRLGLRLRNEAEAAAPGPEPSPALDPSLEAPVAPVAPAAAETVAPPQAEPAPAATPAAPGGDSAEMEQAERLARIIVSDILLYNPEKFDEGVRSGDVVTALRGELEEGRSLFVQRVDPRVGNPDEFLQRELVRVAKERGMEG
jgi:CheY-like chemotaxis protein